MKWQFPVLVMALCNCSGLGEAEQSVDFAMVVNKAKKVHTPCNLTGIFDGLPLRGFEKYVIAEPSPNPRSNLETVILWDPQNHLGDRVQLSLRVANLGRLAPSVFSMIATGNVTPKPEDTPVVLQVTILSRGDYLKRKQGHDAKD